MRKKVIFLGIVFLLAFSGCAEKPEDRPLPTLAPEVQEREEAESEATGENKESEEKENSGGFGIMSYVEKSRQAKDEAETEYLQSRLLIACIDAQVDGVVIPQGTVRFRYTEDFSELDDSYAELKEHLLTSELETDPVKLSVEGNYIMVEISTTEEGRVLVQTELLHE